eukprot:gnl/TRDRNA2_/TRDRNA2_80854_c0_seq1.p1 gnl/TRDRNA2_/TRDRNA2_80854_c0~~gnl/TRDRNA2_/TRDRNA2_80854_c0_seq1.p1  ORF type:complete len:130 (+),score=12.82 gnl/TRDRNA2_/TRDRNA2_80854_c0_seq1:59-448(+)
MNPVRTSYPVRGFLFCPPYCPAHVCPLEADALLAAWLRRPQYILPEKYTPPIELGDASAPAAGNDDEEDDPGKIPLSFRPEEPLTVSRPTEGGTASAQPVLATLASRAAQAEGQGPTVQCPTIAVRRLC